MLGSIFVEINDVRVEGKREESFVLVLEPGY